MNEPKEYMTEQVQNPEFLIQFSLNAIRSGMSPQKVAELGDEIIDQLFDERLANEVELADQATMGGHDIAGPFIPNA